MNPIKWIRDKINQRSSPPTGLNNFVGPGLAGVPVTPETALTLPAALAAINALSTDVGFTPRALYRTLDDGSRRIENGHNLNHLLRRSMNKGRSPTSRQVQAEMGRVLGWGNAYSEIVRDPYSGDPLSIHPLSSRPWETWPSIEQGELWYRIKRGKERLRAENVLHVAGLGWDGLQGYSPVALAREAIGLGLATEKYGATFFGNGSHMGGWIKSKKKMDAEAKKNFREDFEAMHRGPERANRIGILEEDQDFIQTTIPPEEAQFLLTRAFQVLEICRIYRVPPHKLMDFSQAHLANLEESNYDYLTTSLAPWLIAIEDEYNLKLLTRFDLDHGLEIRHDMRTFLRGNMIARAQYYDILSRNGAVTPAEIASLEGFNPVPNGNVHFAPLNMTTLEQLGKKSPDKSKQSDGTITTNAA